MDSTHDRTHGRVGANESTGGNAGTAPSARGPGRLIAGITPEDVRGLLVIVLIMALGAATPFLFVPGRIWSHAGVTRLLGGKAVAQVIRAPTSVKAWRTLGSRKNTDEMRYRDSFANFWKKDGDSIAVPPNLSAELSMILLDPRTYRDHRVGQRKLSIPQPCVVFNFSTGSASIDVFLSFADNTLYVTDPANTNPGGGRELAYADIDSSRAKLVHLLKRIYPQDARIQSLKENRADGSVWGRSGEGR